MAARWLPCILTEENKQQRVECSEEFLNRYENEGEHFLDRIVTTDETWLYYFNPESKQQSSIWKSPDTPPPKKAMVQRSGKMEM